tara:strand:+ start:40968 stop:42023 length:1056 start_codon:yes stop_codon:yes gene_type:complete
VKQLKATLDRIAPVSRAHLRAAQEVIDNKTKPRGSLGRLEEIARRLCAIQKTSKPSVERRCIVVMAADHGVADEGVSAFPKEVTAQMVLNFANDGAAINALAKQAGAELLVVDMGVAAPTGAASVREVRIGPGTRNMRRGPAMTKSEALAAISAGIEIANELADRGIGLIGIGEMGIANTTASSAIASVLTGLAPEELTGLGTGIDEPTRLHKAQVIREAIACNAPSADAPLDVLAALGGFEIAGLVGVTLGAAARNIGVVVDGFISSVAALVAVRMHGAVRDYLFTSHKSVEPGHAQVLRELGHPPLLDLQMRLGEGTGAALAMQLIASAEAFYREMASFESAGVSDSGK